MTPKKNEPTASLQPRVLGLNLSENRNVGISVVRESEEIRIGCFCLGRGETPNPDFYKT